VLNQNIAGINIALCQAFQVYALFFRLERAGKGSAASAGEAQRKKKTV